MNRAAIRLAVIVFTAALAGALITLAIVHPRAKDGDAEAAAAPRRASIENGEPAMMFDVATQQKIGLAATPVQAMRQAEQLQLFGTVVDVQELAVLENQAATARAQAEQVKAKSAYDRAQLARLRTLNAGKNVSDRAVQEAAATVVADASAAASAEASLHAALSMAAQRFGPLIAEGLASHSDLYQGLVSLRELLVQVTLPPGTAAPANLDVATAAGGSITARLLSAAPRVDPRLQGASYFYVAPGGKLAAGMNVIARYHTSRATAGVLVPGAAVVSFEGKSWVYVRRDATHFVRREISMAAPAGGGFFVTNISAGSELVTTGAQQLLSEEMRAQLHGD